MRAYVKTIAAAVAVAALAAAAPAAEGPAKPAPGEAPGKPVALVGSVPITEAQLDETIDEGQLRELRMREFQLRSQALDELIAQKLIENEAAARGVTVPALVKTEIEDKAPMTDAEVAAFYQANKARFGPTPEDEALKQIKARLPQQRQRERRAVWVRELRQKAAVRVLLEPMRVAVDIAGHRSAATRRRRSPSSSSRTSSARYCVAGSPHREQGARDLRRQGARGLPPLPPRLHAQAQKAGEAAACAGEQGKFWEMHDLLFAEQREAPGGRPEGARGRRSASTPRPSTSASTPASTRADVQKDVEQGAGLRGHRHSRLLHQRPSAGGGAAVREPSRS